MIQKRYCRCGNEIRGRVSKICSDCRNDLIAIAQKRVPTPTQIAERAAEIRSEWSEETEISRRVVAPEKVVHRLHKLRIDSWE